MVMNSSRVINADHELSATKMFNYHKGETEKRMNKTLFKGALSYAPSNNNTSRTTQTESISHWSEAGNSQKFQEAPDKFTREKQKIIKQELQETKTGQNHQWKPNPTRSKIPHLQTSLRPRPLKTKSFEELEKEQLEKAPKFKARALNKKILESKGELGLFSNKKRQVTIPQEFHFAINERIPPSRRTDDAKCFDKITLCLKSHKKPIPKNTIPRPFYLQTEKRGARK